MGKALYRKYRPKCLAEVIGEGQVVDTLKKALETKNISHAYLFVGPRGCGKTSVARIFAHEINEFKYELEDNYVDIIEIDGASNRGIDNIRELREKVAIAPSEGKYKVYIIDEVHMLTKEAFNALLKTLEEPPKHAVFIMATTDAYKVPITITSRAQVFTFGLADAKTMFDYVKGVVAKEKINIDDDALNLIVKRGGGSFRDTLSLIDQIANFGTDKITKDFILKTFGLPEDELISNLLAAYAAGDINSITDILKNLFNANTKAETIAEELINQILADPKPIYFKLLDSLTGVKSPFAEAKLLVALTESLQVAPVTVKLAAAPAPKVVASPVVAKPAPAKPVAAQPAPTKETPATEAPAPKPVMEGSEFDWNTFVDNVSAKNNAVSAQLQKAKHTFDGDTLHIYPMKRIVRTILERPNNKSLIISMLGGVKLELHDADEQPNIKENPLVSKISAIMGGAEEVKKDGGKTPF
ncbi:DNA polymerase III subunit gamma/tau [Candidatus Saccharibacteria bacterium]|nr:DNA polymerase III subunit gamma/tau [Candidatus Saccharibacteria bacterium]